MHQTYQGARRKGQALRGGRGWTWSAHLRAAHCGASSARLQVRSSWGLEASLPLAAFLLAGSWTR
eukprot:1721919-Pyramimonas_sp.AAC.1